MTTCRPSPSFHFAYVTNYNDNTVSVIDTRTRKVKATIKTGSGPFEIAVTPDGKYAYVVNKRDNTAQVIKRKTNTIIRTIQVGKTLHRM